MTVSVVDTTTDTSIDGISGELTVQVGDEQTPMISFGMFGVAISSANANSLTAENVRNLFCFVDLGI